VRKETRKKWKVENGEKKRDKMKQREWEREENSERTREERTTFMASHLIYTTYTWPFLFYFILRYCIINANQVHGFPAATLCTRFKNAIRSLCIRVKYFAAFLFLVCSVRFPLAYSFLCIPSLSCKISYFIHIIFIHTIVHTRTLTQTSFLSLICR